MAFRFPFKASPNCVINAALNVLVLVTLAVLFRQWLHTTPSSISVDNGDADRTVEHARSEPAVWSEEDYVDEFESSPVPRETAGPRARAGIYANVRRQRVEIPDDVARGVKKLVLFVGYPRSCHSLIASLLDAHPHVVISHEYDLVKVWKTWSLQEKANRTFVFNKIFNISRTQAVYGLRSAVPGTYLSNIRDAYSYGVPNQWQGNFQDNIELLGDKHGGRTSKHLSGAGRGQIPMNIFEEMERKLKLPLVFIHVMRHPYDNIATMALKQENSRRLVNGTVQQTHLHNITHLYTQARIYCKKLVASVAAVRAKYHMVDIRCEDLVHDPVKTMRTFCSDLKLDCPESYLTDCSRIVSDKPSRTRQFVNWPIWLKKQVTANLSRYTFLSSRYKL